MAVVQVRGDAWLQEQLVDVNGAKCLFECLFDPPTRAVCCAIREWDFGKVFTLKITNVMVLYIVKAATVRQSILEKSFCPLASIGTQFFWLIVSDMTVRVGESVCTVRGFV